MALMITWPISLPQKPAARSWSGGPQSNRVGFQPEVGKPILRRRSSAVAFTFSGTFTGLSQAQLSAFESFYSIDLMDGTLSYNWNDPVDGLGYSWQFADGDRPYTVTHVGGSLYDLSVNLVRSPI